MDGFLTTRAHTGAMRCAGAVDAGGGETAGVWDKHAEPLPTTWAELCLISHALATPRATALDYYTAWRHVHHKLPHRANFTQALSQMLSHAPRFIAQTLGCVWIHVAITFQGLGLAEHRIGQSRFTHIQ